MYRRKGRGALSLREESERGGRRDGAGCGWRTMGASILLSCGERGAARQCGEEGGEGGEVWVSYIFICLVVQGLRSRDVSIIYFRSDS